jgi:hypothetical protein
MTQKVHGAAYAGIWVEKQVTFVKLTFSKDIRALPAADLHVLGAPATPAGAGTVANSEFAVVESVMVSALKTLATRSTILAISTTTNGLTYDVMLGHAASWFSAGDAAGLPDAVTGLITPTPIPVIGAQAVVTTAGAAPTNVLGATVGVDDGAVTVSFSFSHMDGTMPAATSANGGLTFGPGSTPGNIPSPGNTPTGAPGWYPTNLPL